MATLSSAVSSAIQKSLLNNLVAAMAAKFSLEEEDCKTFLQEFLSTQLVKGKGGRTPRRDAAGDKVPGPVSGYIVFSVANREAVTAEMKKGDNATDFKSVGSELGRRWKELSDDERAKYSAEAKKKNADNDSRVVKTPGTPAKTPAKAKAATPAAAAKTPVKVAAPAKAPAAAPAAKQAGRAPAGRPGAGAKQAAHPPPRKQAGRAPPRKQAAVAAHEEDDE